MIQTVSSYSPQKRRHIKNGFKALSNRNYTLAMHHFGEALSLDSGDLDAKIGVLIADIGNDFPKKAEVFNELYQILLATSARANRNNIRKQMLEMLEGFDENLNYISKIAEEEESLESEQLSGITYRDFRVLCLERGFKEAFENLIFSTKIIFTARDDFYQFLQDLIANGFEHIALSYIEDMPQIAYNDKIAKIIQSIRKIKSNTPAKEVCAKTSNKKTSNKE